MVRHGARPDFRTLSLLDHKMVRFFVSERNPVFCVFVLATFAVEKRKPKKSGLYGIRTFYQYFSACFDVRDKLLSK